MSSESKTITDTTNMLKNASAYLLDIEGTTTSISYVKDTLFPYVRANLATYLQENWAEASFQDVLKKLVDQSKTDVEAKMEGAIALDDEEESAEKAQEAVKNSVLWMMDADRKVGALKSLQGQMYVKGYAAGDLKGHLYDDVVPQFKKWTEEGKKLYIYSSGSVEAQKLLFGNTSEGDVTSMISDYFDTEVGPKVEKDSYTKIAEKIGKPVAEILFFTDIVKEADAAKEAGMPVVVMAREGNAPLTEDDKAKFTVLTSFEVKETEEEEVPAKKQKMDEEAKEDKPVEEKSTDVEMKPEETVEAEKKEVNGTNGVHHENGTSGTNGTNGNEEKETNGTEEKETNGTEEKETNGTEDKETNGTEKKETNGDTTTEAVAEKVVSPTKKVVTEEVAGDAPKEVAAE